MSEILEIVMLLSFGASWPMNVIKSYKCAPPRARAWRFCA